MNARLAATALLVVAVGCDRDAQEVIDAERTVLTPGAGNHFGPAYSPDGSKLAFAHPVDGKAAIWIASADGSGAIRHTFGVWDATPMWSPDGQWIAFYRDSSSDVWAAPVGEGSPVHLAAGPAIEFPVTWLPDGSGFVFDRGFTETWVVSLRDTTKSPLLDVRDPYRGVPSPDGTRVAYLRRQSGKQTLWVWERAGNAHRQITTEGYEGAGDFRYAWSPDGTRFLFLSTRTGTTDVWVASVETGETHQLTRDIRNDYGPAWSPDGRWVAFLSDRGGQTDVWVAGRDGGQETRVTDDLATEAGLTWTPDVTGLTFSYRAGVNHIWSVPAGGGTPRQLTFGSSPDDSPEVSPDGTQILFTARRSGSQDVWVVPVAGGEPRRITQSPVDDQDGQWSPDGRTIAFVSGRSGNLDVWTVPAAGGDAVQLTNWPTDEFSPSWSPDGRTIAFVSGRDAAQGDVWTIPAAGGEASRVTRLDAGPGRPQWTPDGRNLVFGALAREHGPTAIYRVGASGGSPTTIVQGEVGSPRVSPDGRQVLYLRAVGGYSYVHTVPTAGGAPRRLTAEDRSYDINPRWSPDGTQIVFEPYGFANDADYIAVMPASGGPARAVAQSPTLLNTDPRWTPDGQTIVYVSAQSGSQIVNVRVAELLGRATP